MGSKDSELNELHNRISKLERIEKEYKIAEEKLKIANQQLEAGNRQIKANNEQRQQNEVLLKHQKEEIQRAREFAENIIDTVRQPLMVLDGNLKVITANRYFYQLFHATEKETIGNLLYDLGNKQWNIPGLKGLLKDILPKESAVQDYEVVHRFKGIGRKIMLLNARELRQKKGKERMILLAIEDITARRNAEKKLKRLNQELERKAAELQQILYITTHDLRSPLVNIDGFTKEMQESIKELESLLENITIDSEAESDINRIMGEDIPEAIHFITSSTTKMDNLLQGLLALSRLGRQKLTFRQLDMKSLIDNVIENFRFEVNQTKTEIIIEKLPPCRADELQINQLFSNLVGNSLKFLDPNRRGRIKISGKKGKKGCTYKVEDNGIGIPDGYREKIFGLFEKLHPKKPGIGLGMNIVKQIVDKHEGTIQFESELGKGTKFIIFIPD